MERTITSSGSVDPLRRPFIPLSERPPFICFSLMLAEYYDTLHVIEEGPYIQAIIFNGATGATAVLLLCCVAQRLYS